MSAVCRLEAHLVDCCMADGEIFEGQDGSQRNLYGHLWGYVKRARIALKDQSQQWLTIPVEISDPLKSIATKAGAHVATGKAISTGTVGLMDSLNGWRDAVPVYVCLQTRGVWQLGYLNDTVELVPQGELNMSHTLQITALENLWQAARLVVPGQPENVALEMDSSDLGALSRVGIAPYWLLWFVLVGTCTAVSLSIFLPRVLLLLCILRIVMVAVLCVV